MVFIYFTFLILSLKILIINCSLDLIYFNKCINIKKSVFCNVIERVIYLLKITDKLMLLLPRSYLLLYSCLFLQAVTIISHRKMSIFPHHLSNPVQAFLTFYPLGRVECNHRCLIKLCGPFHFFI